MKGEPRYLVNPNSANNAIKLSSNWNIHSYLLLDGNDEE